MSKFCGLWLLFFPWVLEAALRDPFQPPAVSPCVVPADAPQSWQLKGIIGQQTLRYGWVITASGQWLRLKPQQTLLNGSWQVGAIHPNQLALTVVEGSDTCQSSTGNVLLRIRKS
jgi:pilus assembly protein HofP